MVVATGYSVGSSLGHFENALKSWSQLFQLLLVSLSMSLNRRGMSGITVANLPSLAVGQFYEDFNKCLMRKFGNILRVMEHESQDETRNDYDYTSI